MMNYTTILLEKNIEARLGVITLNRPEVRNAINPTMREELSRAFDELEGDADVRAIIITGSPKVFAAGADIAAGDDDTHYTRLADEVALRVPVEDGRGQPALETV